MVSPWLDTEWGDSFLERVAFNICFVGGSGRYLSDLSVNTFFSGSFSSPPASTQLQEKLPCFAVPLTQEAHSHQAGRSVCYMGTLDLRLRDREVSLSRSLR